ncbi:MAG TPA: NAD(P)H-dependent glycerol-3-phosphate dehydrogenase, partial [Calditrichia bacterium]|nr:NAD(P)H-dependent glycerol-3-phosphate dehydrogenase [Calditrichia bacterium]
MKTRIAVVGAGSWGNTLAILLAKKDYDVTMWCYDKKQYQEMVRDRQNPAYLPGIDFPDNLKLTDTLSRDLLDCPFVVFAVPTHAMRQTCQNVAGMLRPDSIMVNVSKGIENDSLKRMSEIISETLDIPASRIATLYGPSHAEEVSKGIATAVVSASPDLETARAVRDLFSTDYFRVYSSTDIIGVEVGGSLKNVIAIAAGICDGAGFGDNTKAALLTRGLAEMARLGEELGA